MDSLWASTSKLPEFPKLEGNIKTDVLIIGGGIAGILCAYMLERAGVDYVLAEAGTICGGITKNTTAKISSQHGLIYDKLIRRFGVESARIYLEANEAAIREYGKLCRGIDCGYEERDSFVYSLDDRRKIENELAALERLGSRAEFCDRLPLPFQIAGAVKFKAQAQFHPLKFIGAIAKGLNIYEHTPVRELIKNTALTGRGNIEAGKIIAATHFPFINKHGGYFIKIYQQRSYVIALENAPSVGGMLVDEADKGMSFRDSEGLLIIGGGGNRTGKECGGWHELLDFSRRYYPEARVKYRWATQDCITLDGIPYIGRYSKRTPDFFTATGFNKWGMTSAMVSAILLTDMIIGRDNPYAGVFSPSRTVFRTQLAVNAIESTVNLLSFSKKRCPHLGCALKWNRRERSWDCPCHGSRFTEDGKLIDNPATGDLKTR